MTLDDLEWSFYVCATAIILHILRTNGVVFIVSRTWLTFYDQVQLTWSNGRRLTTSVSGTVKLLTAYVGVGVARVWVF